MKEAGRNHEAFQPLFDQEEWNRMTHARRMKALEMEAEHMRSKVTNCLQEMKSAKYAATQNKIRKHLAQSNQEAEEKFLGRQIPDPLKAIPAYLESKAVQDMNVWICEAAETKLIVSDKQLSKITNHLLVRLSIKNGLRKQVGLFRTADLEPFRTIHTLGLWRNDKM